MNLLSSLVQCINTLLRLETEPGQELWQGPLVQVTKGTLGCRGIRINDAVVGMHAGRECELP